MADIVLRSPFSEMRRLMEELWDEERRPGRLFPRLADISLVEDGALALDVEEKNGGYAVTASVPGFKRDEIKIHVKEGVLTISAERSEEREEKEQHFVRRERHAGSLMRRTTLPGIGAQSQVDARLKDGVLTINLSVPEEQQAKQIEIHEG
jgi:HSP20 family protein